MSDIETIHLWYALGILFSTFWSVVYDDLFMIGVNLMNFTVIGIAHANLMLEDLVNLVLLSSDRWMTSRYDQFAL